MPQSASQKRSRLAMCGRTIGLTIASVSIGLIAACGRSSGGDGEIDRRLTCDTHVHCREVTEYPEIAGARAGTREALAPIDSIYTGRAYEVSIYLPARYHDDTEDYPVIYSLDGDGLFDARADAIDRQQKDVILVSIHSDASRVFDYRYYNGLGETLGGQDFYRYIVLELGPYVESQYRIDAGRRALEGQSHGGYFTVYSLFEDALDLEYFNTFVAIDPTIWTHEASLRTRQDLLRATANELDIDVFLSSGLPGYPLVSNGDVTEALYEYFVAASFARLRIHYFSYDLGHAEVIHPAFADFLHEHY